MIKIKNLTKSYKSKNTIVNALDNINLEFDKKGLVFVLGESGSGKSTLLNIIGCLDSYDGGYVCVNNYNLASLNNEQKAQFRAHNISFIFQDLNLLNEINVYDNIKISLDLIGVKDESLIDNMAKYLEIEDLLDKKVVNLSGGERQRVAIARSLIKNPKVILADEPTGSLDSLNSENIMKLIKKISKDALVIVVSHDKDLASKYGDRIIKLEDGKVIFDSKKKKKTNNEIVSNNVIKVDENYKKETLDYLNKKIESYNKDVYVSFQENERVNYALFKEDIDLGVVYDSEIKIDSSNNYELKKSKLALNNIFKITISNLVSRIKYILLTIVLIAFSFSLYVSSGALGEFNKNEAYIKTIKEENIKGINFVYFDSLDNKERISDNIVKELKHETHISRQYKLKYKLPLNKTVGGSKYLMISGIGEIDDFSNYGYEFKEGNGNFTSYDEIVIEENMADELLSGEYFKDSVIGKKLVIYDKEYKIIGVIKDSSLLKDKVKNQDITSRMIFVKEGFMEYFYNNIDVYQDNYIISSESQDYYASIVFDDYVYNEQLSYVYDDGKSEVKSNDILVSESIYHQLNDKENVELTISSTEMIIYKGVFNVVGYYTYNNIEGIDNTNISNLYGNSILLSSEYKEEIGANLHYNYQLLMGLKGNNKENEECIKKAISLGLVISNDFVNKYDIYASSVESLSTYLNVASVVFLLIALVFIISYIKINVDNNSKTLGTLHALGFNKYSIVLMSLLEHSIIVLLGLVLSIIISVSIVPLVNLLITSSMGFYFSSYIISFNSIISICVISLFMIVLSLLFSWIKNNKESVNIINNRNE